MSIDRIYAYRQIVCNLFRQLGNFWIAEPEKMNIPGSKGWDSNYPRVTTWAVMLDKVSGKRFFYMNTHLDHIGRDDRPYQSAIAHQHATVSKVCVWSRLVVSRFRTHQAFRASMARLHFRRPPLDRPYLCLLVGILRRIVSHRPLSGVSGIITKIRYLYT